MADYYSSGGWKKWLWIYVVVAIIVYGAIYVYLKNKNGGNLYGSSSNTPTPTVSVSSSVQTNGTIIQTMQSASLGGYLADGNNKALYTYGSDTVGVSNCTGACLVTWPVYSASGSASLPANVTVINRADGGLQHAYKGLPLYYFTGDASGQVTGDGLNNFHVAKP